MKIHFIAIGGAVMHNLAIALQEKGHQISGSDDEILEPSRSRLEASGLLQNPIGWDPKRVHAGLDAVIIGMHARRNNPELKKAQKLGLKIYSFPEYLYEQSKNKKRIVIGGSHGKTTITAMVMHVLKDQQIDFDYMVGSQIEGFDTMVKLTDEAPFVIFEGDEYLSSPLDRTPKFHQYNPHITLLSGIAWDHMNVFPTFETYKKQFRQFLRIATGGGKVFYYEGDPELGEVVDKSHWSLLKIPYGEHPHRIEDGRCVLVTKYGSVPLCFFGRHNMQNIQGALLLCRDLGVEDHQFYQSIQHFSGVEQRQQLLANGDQKSVYLDFASAPVTVKASVSAFKETYHNHKLVACLELHSYSSLHREYMTHYQGTLDDADEALVYFNPDSVKRNGLPALTPEIIKEQFQKDDLRVFNDPEHLTSHLKSLDNDSFVLLILTSGDLSGTDLRKLAQEVVEG